MNAPGQSDDYRDDSSTVATRRAALRRERLAAREAMSAEARADASARIEAHLAARLERLPAGILAFCWPMRGEFDSRPLALRLLGRGWRLCQPVVIARDQAMVFRAWAPETPMAADPYGIPVPAGGPLLHPDLVLAPLVAFDAGGYRLGYGGGYFDRTLASLAARPFAVGVGFELGYVDDLHPQAHDVRMDAIVTEAGWRDSAPAV